MMRLFILGFAALLIMPTLASAQLLGTGSIRWRSDPPQIGNCKDNRPQCCPACNPDPVIGALGAALNGVANAVQATEGALASAQALDSDAPTSVINAQADKTNSTVSGAALEEGKSLESSGKEGLLGSLGGFGAGAAGKGKGGSFGSGGGMGSFLDGLLGKLSPGPGAKTSEAKVGALEDGEASAGGKGGWAAGREMRGGSGLFGGGRAVGSNPPAAVGTTAFEGADGARPVEPMASADPEDYFARTSLDLNLFKLVERRYQQEFVTWQTRRAPK
jgi:hypothetical protein